MHSNLAEYPLLKLRGLIAPTMQSHNLKRTFENWEHKKKVKFAGLKDDNMFSL